MEQGAGGKTTDTMNKNRIEGRDWSGKGALDPDAQNLCGDRRGKFGVGCREALSLIPGGPRIGQRWLRTLRSVRTSLRESAEGVVAEPTFDREGPNRKTIRKSEL